MGLLSLFKNLNLGFGMPHTPKTPSSGTMEAKEFKEAEHVSKVPLAGDHHEITGADKDTRIKSDEENMEGKLEEVFSGQRKLTKLKGQENITSSEKVGQMECKFYLLPGGCKSGNDCRFLHNVQLNFLGLPIRPGEKKCPFYMRTGGCKFAGRCRFNHPDPIALVGDSFQDHKNDASSQHHGHVEQLCKTSRPSENTLNEQTAFLGPFAPNWGLQQNVHWNGNQTSTSPLHIREMNINEFNGSVKSQQFDEYPQRPGEPECQYFMKTGYCKFKSACRFHHPKSNYSGSVEQFCGTPLLSENTSEERTAVLGLSSSFISDLFRPNQGLESNTQWNENQTSTSPLHAQEMNIKEFNGGVKSQQFDEYPQRPGVPECQYFMKTGYCKFKSACRNHHPKSKYSGPVEQLCGTPLPSENTSEEQTTVLGPSSSFVLDLFTPNQGLESNAQWNENQTVTTLLHPPDIKSIDQQLELANKDAASEFSGGEPQQFDEYPQRPNEPECQYFMKTGYCKFKSACRYHHPKSNLSSLSLSPRPASNNNEQDDPVEQLCEIPLPSEKTSNDRTAFLCPSSSDVPGQANAQWNGDQMGTSPLHPQEIKMNLKGQELANKDASQEFNGGLKLQQFDEYPQRPGEPECQHFMKNGYCKFKSACRCHHPKTNISFPARPLKPDKPICTHYRRRGICKFGSACKFSHHVEHS